MPPKWRRRFATREMDTILRTDPSPMYDPIGTPVYSASAENIDTTIVERDVVFRNGVFSCGIDEAQLYREVVAEMEKAGLTDSGMST